MTKKSSLTFLKLFICALILFSQILIAVNIFLSYIQCRLTYTVICVVEVLNQCRLERAPSVDPPSVDRFLGCTRGLFCVCRVHTDHGHTELGLEVRLEQPVIVLHQCACNTKTQGSVRTQTLKYQNTQWNSVERTPVMVQVHRCNFFRCKLLYHTL